MKGKKLSKAFLSVAIVIALVLGSAVIPGSPLATVVFADTYERLEAEKKAIQEKIKKNEQKIAELEGSISEQEDKLAVLNESVKSYEEKISVLDKSISVLDARIDDFNIQIDAVLADIKVIEEEIADINVQIDQKQEEIDATVDVLKDRLKASYIAGEVSDLEILLGSKSMTSFITRMEILERVSGYDQELIKAFEGDIMELDSLIDECNKQIDSRNAKKAEIEKKKLAVQEDKNAVQADRDELSAAKAEVDSKYAEVYQIAMNLENKGEAYEDAIVLLNKQEEELNKEISEFLKANASSSDDDPESYDYYVSNEKWGFPLRNSSNYSISSEFGQRSRDYHKGIDICSGSSDKTVVASRSGKVIRQGWHSSMGNYIMIDHGDGYVTIYMHFREPAYVGVGTKVSQGQAIGYMGTTGNSTGVHLHFQVNYNGTPINPRNVRSF